MLTYRTGSAGSGQAARNMAEHLLQQTLPPEMAVMADYYEQGVTPPTLAEATASRYTRIAGQRMLEPGDALDALLATEAQRIGESALGQNDGIISPKDLSIMAAASFIGAGLLTADNASAALARIGIVADTVRLNEAAIKAQTEHDYTSATAAPRADMNPHLAARLGINPSRGLTPSEVAFLLSGKRADGEVIQGQKKQSATIALSEIFGLDPLVRPTRVEIERILNGETAAGERLENDIADKAVKRFIAAMGVQSKEPTLAEREYILSGYKADGSLLTDQAYKTIVEASKARIGYIDLTFSAPKSLSIAWAFSPTTAERAMLHRAHTDAIESVLNTVEAEIGRARKGMGGKDGAEAGSIGWVKFDHYAARPTVEVIKTNDKGDNTTELHTLTGTTGRVPGDMQVHTHVAIFNAVETASGRVGGLDLAQLDGKIHEWGALYQAYLATNLRAHGVEIGLDKQNNMARLTAVPENVIQSFSKRTLTGTEAAREYAASLGLEWNDLSPERQIGLLKSGVQNPREAKTDDVSDLASWKKMAKDLNYDHRSVLRPDAPNITLSREERLETAFQAALPILERQFEQNAVIDGADARVAAAKSLIVAGIENADEINALTAAFRERGIQRRGENAGLIWGYVPSSQGREKVAITTSLDAREEQLLIDTVKAGAGDLSGTLSIEQINAAISQFPELDFTNEHGEAQRAVIETLGTGGRIGLAIGVAGSGKSTLLKPLVKAWQDEGRDVHGLALAWRQSDDLADAGIATKQTRAVASFLRAVERGKLPLNKNSVLVIDEIGLLGTRQLNEILAVQRQTNCQLVMLGDPNQMQAVEAGPVIDLMRKGLGADSVPELATSVRQKTHEERETTLMLRNGQTAAALDRKADNGTLLIAPGGYRDSIEHTADLWRQRYEANRHRPGFSITVSAPTNSEAHDLSIAIREKRKAMGEVAGDQMKITATDGDGKHAYEMSLAPGDRVRLFARTNATYLDSKTVGNIGRNGSVLEIVEVSDKGLILRSQAGREGLVQWDSLKIKDTNQIRLAYGDALTTNTAQGSTVTEHIHAMPSGSRLVTAFGAYTSGSRHKEISYIVTSEGAERAEVSGRRPLGDPRPVTRHDIIDNLKRNLSRQVNKDSALDLIEKANNLRRETRRGTQKSFQSLESVQTTGMHPTALRATNDERILMKALERTMPQLMAAIRRQTESLQAIVKNTASLADRITGMAAEKLAWNQAAATTADATMAKTRSRGLGR